MSKLPSISGKQCIQALKKAGFVTYRQRVRDTPKAQVTIPNHKTIAKGTLRAILRQADLTVDEFDNLL